jgi:hypothetical protein
MAKVKFIALMLIVALAGCGLSEPLPRTPFQKALARMPAVIMGLQTRPLKMKGFVFNNIEYTRDVRGLVLETIENEEQRLHWLLAMGNNLDSSVSKVLPLGKWDHTPMLNPTTWKWNIFDVANDHEAISSTANMDDYIDWMNRHNFQVINRQYATVMQSTGRHVDSDVFGSGVVIGPDGVVFIERPIPSDNSTEPAFRLYTGEGQSLMSIPEIYEVSSKLPSDAFTSIVLKLESSVDKHNQLSQEYWNGVPIGSPLSNEQTIEYLGFGRPKTLTWIGIAHTTKNGRHGLQFELLYSSEEEAKNDIPSIEKAISKAKGRFTKKDWWKQDMRLLEPTISQDGKFITIWSDFDMDPQVRQKIEKNDITYKEAESLWLDDVPALVDFLYKLERHDYGPFWQRE